jgi:hypothetical protein
MFVTANGVEYKVSWRHGNNEPEPETGTRVCTCIITNKTTGEEITGYAFCRQGDNYDKSVGRKMSMTDALAVKDWTGSDTATMTLDSLFDRDTRKLFWDTYFNRNTQESNNVT